MAPKKKAGGKTDASQKAAPKKATKKKTGSKNEAVIRLTKGNLEKGEHFYVQYHNTWLLIHYREDGSGEAPSEDDIKSFAKLQWDQLEPDEKRGYVRLSREENENNTRSTGALRKPPERVIEDTNCQRRCCNPKAEDSGTEHGGRSTTHLTPYASPQRVQQPTRQRHRAMAEQRAASGSDNDVEGPTLHDIDQVSTQAVVNGSEGESEKDRNRPSLAQSIRISSISPLHTEMIDPLLLGEDQRRPTKSPITPPGKRKRPSDGPGNLVPIAAPPAKRYRNRHRRRRPSREYDEDLPRPQPVNAIWGRGLAGPPVPYPHEEDDTHNEAQFYNVFWKKLGRREWSQEKTCEWILAKHLGSGGFGSCSLWLKIKKGSGTIEKRIVCKDVDGFTNPEAWHGTAYWAFDGFKKVPLEAELHSRLWDCNQTNILPFVAFSVDFENMMHRLYTGYADYGDLWSLKRVTNYGTGYLLDEVLAQRKEQKIHSVPEPFIWYVALSLVSACEAMAYGPPTSYTDGAINVGDSPAAKWFEIVHRDLKPNNIVLGQANDSMAQKYDWPSVYLMDFGIAVELRPEWRNPKDFWSMGTQDYMAPEQIRHTLRNAPVNPLSSKTNIYGIGCVLYFLMEPKGRPPRNRGLGDKPADQPLHSNLLKDDLQDLYWSPENMYSEELKLTVKKAIEYSPLRRISLERLRVIIQQNLDDWEKREDWGEGWSRGSQNPIYHFQDEGFRLGEMLKTWQYPAPRDEVWYLEDKVRKSI